ncbi:porin [Shewanella sp. 5_MG-2023]|uniref:porin n=1 Tax=Shewanella sp. 5_MG-2023 TaxID=3062656 RepID=UPI0026E200BB|nr:porin [Shewanella sp. 5_MG-2023]MDO6640138.1 porin [Shewanella sp. 5_MG-2023]
MNNKRLIMLGMATLSITPQVTVAAENANWLPTLYGSTQAQVRYQSNESLNAQIAEANLGLKGLYKSDGLTLSYNTRLQYSDNFTDTTTFNDIELLDAGMRIAYKNYGGIYIGEGVTGTWKDLYSKVDIHASNNMELSSGGSLFETGKYGHNAFAYSTPKISGDLGTLWFKAAVITPNQHNDTDIDIFGLRALYHGENYNLIINRAQIDKKVFGSVDENCVRWTIAADYQWDNVTLAALAELTESSPSQAKSVYSAALTYNYNNIDFGISFQTKSWEDEAQNPDQNLTIATIKYHFSDNITLYTEAALYKEQPVDINPNDAHDDNVNIGFIFHF